MILLAPVLLAGSMLPQPQAAAPGVVIWPHGVSPLGITHKESFGNHGLSITVHDKSGVAEIHQTTADIMIVQSGEATLVYGGEVIDPRVSAPNEIRGSGIRGGVTVHVTAGDVIHFAAGVPHQWLLEPGKQITYLVVHVSDPPASKP